MPEIDFTVCGCCCVGGAVALTVTLSGRASEPAVPSTRIVARVPFAAGAFGAADSVKVTLCGLGWAGEPLNWMGWPHPPQLTPSGRPVTLIVAAISALSGVTSTLIELLLPASMVTEPVESVILAAEAGVAGTASSAPETSATTTPARCFQARRCVDTSTAFRV
ncbi:hypothetical protein [Micromonospora fulviviridis]|uniref:Secreted protein n=1 Tax=Micromonospora fulviviridis TaxID=47860 RepID=A0ABV2VJ31_9ACTN